MEGLMPLISPKVQPKASLFSLSRAINLISWSPSRSEAIMTGKDSLGPRNAYLRESGRGFSSRAGGETVSETDSEAVVSKQSAVEHKSSNSKTSYSGSSSTKNDSYSTANTSSQASSRIESSTQ